MICSAFAIPFESPSSNNNPEYPNSANARFQSTPQSPINGTPSSVEGSDEEPSQLGQIDDYGSVNDNSQSGSQSSESETETAPAAASDISGSDSETEVASAPAPAAPESEMSESDTEPAAPESEMSESDTEPAAKETVATEPAWLTQWSTANNDKIKPVKSQQQNRFGFKKGGGNISHKKNKRGNNLTQHRSTKSNKKAKCFQYSNPSIPEPDVLINEMILKDNTFYHNN